MSIIPRDQWGSFSGGKMMDSPEAQSQPSAGAGHCRDCRYWAYHWVLSRISPDLRLGQCRLGPPARFVQPVITLQAISMSTERWPIVMSDESCGEFKAVSASESGDERPVPANASAGSQDASPEAKKEAG